MRKTSSSVNARADRRVQPRARSRGRGRTASRRSIRVQPVAAALADVLDDLLEDARRDGEVEDAVSPRAALLVELVERARRARSQLASLVELGLHVADPGGEPLPDVLVQASRQCSWTASFISAWNSSRGHLASRDADDGEPVGQEVAHGERVEGGEELALRQVAGGAEDRQRAGLGRARERCSPSRSGFSARAVIRPSSRRARRTGCEAPRSPWPRTTRPGARRSARRARR